MADISNSFLSSKHFILEQLQRVPFVGAALDKATWPPSADYLREFVLPIFVAAAILFLVHYISSMALAPQKKFGAKVKVAGPGVAYRHDRFLAFLETPFEGANTIAAMFEIAAKNHYDKKFLGTRKLLKRELEKDEKTGRKLEKLSLGEYQWETYGQVYERAVNFSSGLMNIGHKSTEKVAIFAETRAEWYIGLQASMRQSLTVVTVYASLGEDALIHSLNETEVTTVICDSKQLEKICEVGSKLETLKHVIYMGEQLEDVVKPTNAPSHWKIETFEAVEKIGLESKVEANPPSPSDVAVIMYTSGSTGMPKGVVMSHANIVATIAAVFAVVPDVGPTDVYLAYLPLAHVLELSAEVGMAAIGASIGYGSPLTLIDSSNKVKKGTKGDAPTLSPTLMAAVPAILDRIRDGVRKKVDSAGGMGKTLFDLAYDRRLAAIEGSYFGAWGLEKIFWDTLVFKKVRAAIGGRVRFMLSGGAPLSGDTQRFMNICFGMPIGQGYGLTETCAGGTFSEWDDTSVGRVGPPIPCSFIKLIDWDDGGYRTTDQPIPRGEICIGGPNVTQGYYKNPSKTAEDYHVDSEGLRWFHTGDIGQFHSDGVLEIVDRKKDIIKLQAGEYVSLGKVEAALQACSMVENVMVHAEPTKNYATALVVPSKQSLVEWANSKGIDSSDFVKLCDNKEAVGEVLKAISKTGKDSKLERFEVPQKIKLLSEPWTPESGLVTAALKLKRENLRKQFATELAELYA